MPVGRLQKKGIIYEEINEILANLKKNNQIKRREKKQQWQQTDSLIRDVVILSTWNP